MEVSVKLTREDSIACQEANIHHQYVQAYSKVVQHSHLHFNFLLEKCGLICFIRNLQCARSKVMVHFCTKKYFDN